MFDLWGRRVRGCAAIVLVGFAAGCAAAARAADDPGGAGSERTQDTVAATGIRLVIHGGAGTITRAAMSPERERAYRAALAEALQAGYAVLANGGSSLDAVVAAIVLLEDSPLFNAARGAVFTAEGRNELDASIMDGRTLAAGAVAGVTRVKNPIQLARLVMERTEHVMLAGSAADAFGEEQGVEIVAPSYFFTRSRWNSLLRARDDLPTGTSHDAPLDDASFGTVGAVALDRAGNLAAGTSTGGMTNKLAGRVGDSPIIGAGTYANNQSCAVSATGHGEYFIRGVIAYDVCALVEYRGLSLREAADRVILEKLPALGGTGGVIALDRTGSIAMQFNTEGMYRGHIDDRGRTLILIHGDEAPR